MVCLVRLSILLHFQIQLFLSIELLSGIACLSGRDFLDLRFLLLLLVLIQSVALILPVILHNGTWSRYQFIVKRAVSLVRRCEIGSLRILNHREELVKIHLLLNVVRVGSSFAHLE